MRLPRTILFSICFQLCFVAGAQSQSLPKIRIGYPSISSRQAQLWIAKDEGLFRKHGLDVELIFLRGGQVAIQALTGGDPPIVTIGNVIVANLQGHDIILVGSVENSYDQSVMVRAGTMLRVEQLKGKRFGISGFGSATHTAALILFKKFNLEPNKDVSFVPTGTGPERLAAMSAGRIDATFFNPSEVPQALKAGFVEIIQMADIGLKFKAAVWPRREAMSKLIAKSSSRRSRRTSKESITYLPTSNRRLRAWPGTCGIMNKTCSITHINITSSARQRSPIRP